MVARPDRGLPETTGSGTGEITGCRVNAIPDRTAAALAALGVPATCEASFQAQGETAANWPVFDPRTANAALVAASETPTIGGGQQRYNSGGYTQFAPAGTVDTFELYHPRRSANGSMKVEFDGVAQSPISQTVTPNDYVKSVVTTTLGSHVIKLSNNSGTAWAPAIVAYDSASPTIICMNAGVRNATSTDWTVASYPHSPLNAISVLAPQLAVIAIGINDARTGTTTVAQFSANVQAIIDACRLSGGVILMYPTPISSGSYRADFTQAQLNGAYDALAAANGLALVDSNAATGSYAAMTTAGEVYDTFHLHAAAYALVANMLAPAIRGFFGL